MKREDYRAARALPRVSIGDILLWLAALLTGGIGLLASMPALKLLFYEVPKQMRFARESGGLFGEPEKAALVGLTLAAITLVFLAASAGSIWWAVRRSRRRKTAHVTG